jgi:methionine-rich copper-binding protein CopC
VIARRTLIGLVAALPALIAAGPAFAHAELVSTAPKNGAVVRHLPKTVSLTFGEALERVVSVRIVHQPGRQVGRGARLNPRNAKQVLARTSADRTGRYTVVWRVIAPDGDTQVGSFGFRVRR